MRNRRAHAVAWLVVAAGFAAAGAAACSGGRTVHPSGAGTADGSADAGPVEGGVVAEPVVISVAAASLRTGTWGVNYWQWSPTYGDYITGTDALIGSLAPGTMRVGGYNNDANTPNPFDNAQLDTAVAYAHAIGAQPILQVPLLQDTNGAAPTPATAAAMVTYANVTQGYGVKYFSIGNEPDIYSKQGLPSDSTQPAIPGYQPSDYCASARAYVTAMKAVDPTIQIVGPDLSYQYQPGADWLTPVLQTCGDLFDVVSIHRYPFEAAQATLAAAEADVDHFRAVVGSVRAILLATGQGSKPLALTEMNIVYDATPAGSVLAASPGTVPSALWLADAVGAALSLNLWTTAVWDVSDVSDWSLGLLGPPPAHTPRPEFYAYAAYAAGFGNTLLGVTAQPSGIRAYASRDAANDATVVVAVNWRTTPAALAFVVTDLAQPPPPPIFVLPALSIARVVIPDSGMASAATYGEAEHTAGTGFDDLPRSAGVIGDGGAGSDDAGSEGAADEAGTGPLGCPTSYAPHMPIMTMGRSTTNGLAYGTPAEPWGSFTYAPAAQPAPTIAVTPDGNGMQISTQFVTVPAPNANYEGAGLYFSSSSCIDGSAYTGVQFDLSGDLGTCLLQFIIAFAENLSITDDPTRGACVPSQATCYGSAAPVAGTGTGIQVPFSALSGGMPHSTVDVTKIVSVQWQVSDTGAPGPDGGGCAADFTVANAAFY